MIKRLSRSLILAFTLIVASAMILPCASAGTAADTSAEQAGNVKVFKATASSAANAREINSMVSGNDPKTIVFEPGTNVKVRSVIRPGSNTTIIATGATLTFPSGKNCIFTTPKDTDYKSIENLKVIGGTWRSSEAGGRHGSMMVVSHGSNITFDGVDVNANYVGHSIEIIACKNVTVNNCTITSLGTCSQDCIEEALQFDLATKKTAPKIAEYGSKYVQGQTCRNITVTNNVIKGANGIRVNWTPSENGKYKSRYHYNVNITGNKITGKSSEALAVYNTVGVTIKNNTCISSGRKTGNIRTTGIHMDMYGKAPKAIRKDRVVVTGNTVRGGNYGIFIYKHSNKKHGRATVKKNRIYCRKGKSRALVKRYVRKACSRASISGNKCSKW